MTKYSKALIIALCCITCLVMGIIVGFYLGEQHIINSFIEQNIIDRSLYTWLF